MKNMSLLYFINQPKSILVLFGVVICLISFNFAQSQSEPKLVLSEEKELIVPPKSTGIISYPIAGLVEASESMTLYAKRSGYIKSITVTEGDTVESGDLLILAVDPAIDARLSVQDLLNTINVLKAKSAVVSSVQQLTTTNIDLEQSITLKNLTDSASSLRTELAQKQLLATLTQVEAVVPQSLRFVQDNVTLFTSDSMKHYTEVVKLFYGQEPDHLRIGVVTAGNDESLLKKIDKLKQSSITNEELLELATAVESGLGVISDLYTKSESEFFDKKQLSSNSPEFTGYLEFRTLISELSVGLLTMIDSATILDSGENINELTSSTSVATTLVNKNATISLTDITSTMENMSERLSEAELEALATEIDLGVSRAPFLATVTEVYINNGQYVEVGEPLLRLSGSNVQEMKIKLSGIAFSVQIGDAFLVDGKTVGLVDRVVSVLEAGSATAYIKFTEVQNVGAIIKGRLMVSVGAGYSTISRKYLAFDNVGAYVTTKAGEKIYLKIIYDYGSELVVDSEREINEELLPAFGVRL